MKSFKQTCGAACVSLLTALLLLFAAAANAQPTDAFVSMRATATEGIMHGVYYIEVPDTGNVSDIEIKLGTDWNLSDLVNASFVYDIPASLSSGFSYSRSGNIIAVDIGDYDQRNAYFGEVRIKESGTWSSFYSFVSN
ncbi:MAG TPA: hypothetical protein PK210_12145 [Bacteroidia bacterium]|jgi:hypothetical protein|nr:hypothetical protein [Bacteroidia bacterium]